MMIIVMAGMEQECKFKEVVKPGEVLSLLIQDVAHVGLLIYQPVVIRQHWLIQVHILMKLVGHYLIQMGHSLHGGVILTVQHILQLVYLHHHRIRQIRQIHQIHQIHRLILLLYLPNPYLFYL